MRLLHGNEMHFVRCPDGRVYATGVNVYTWWQEYLRVFDEVLVVSRVRRVNELLPPERLAEGPGVTFCDLPDFRGPEQYLRQAQAVKAALRAAIDQADAFIFRVPGTIGYLGARELTRRGLPYGYEVVGDPYDVFTAGSVRHPLRLYFQHWHVRNLRRFSRTAAAACYVTEQALQRRYPPGTGAFTTHFSDVGLSPDFYAHSSRILRASANEIKLLFVGTLEQLYKAPDILIKAVAECRKRGADVSLTLAGEGAMRKSLEKMAAELSIRDSVRFAGHVAGRDRLMSLLDDADLFVLPSRAEGLPRSMLEAMARAVPCIGSTVNGIPELIAPEDLVPPNDVQALEAKIIEVLRDPARLMRMSARNLRKAHDFDLETMRARKMAYLEYVRDASSRHRVVSMPVQTLMA